MFGIRSQVRFNTKTRNNWFPLINKVTAAKELPFCKPCLALYLVLAKLNSVYG